MVHHWLILLMAIVFSIGAWAQDERYFRQIFSGELPRQEVVSENIPQFNVEGARYKIDLNDDKMEESIEPLKIDGVDWLRIKTSGGTTVFEQKLPATGAFSNIYKIKFVHISTKVKALLIFLDEGHTKGKRFESTARFFVLTFENNDLSKITMTQGPHFFHEKEKQRDQYWRRDYSVNIYDIDGDGTREIAVQYNHIQRIMKYEGKGEWKRL